MTDDRAQSIALDYVLALSVGFLLITGLIVAGSDFVADQRDRVQESELRVIGQQVAAEMAAADRLALAATDGEVRIERRLPDDVAQTGYRIEVVADETPSLRLAPVDGSVSVRVELANETAVAANTVQGGNVVVTTTASGEITVEESDRYA